MRLRLPHAYAFALLRKVHPTVSPLTVLRGTEVFYSFPSLSVFLAGLLLFTLKAEMLTIAWVTATVYVIAQIVHRAGFFIPPLSWLVYAASAFRSIRGILEWLVLAGVAFTCVGWKEFLTYSAARAVLLVAFWTIDAWEASRNRKILGMDMGQAERSFIHSYRWHAENAGFTASLVLSDEDLQKEQWFACFALFNLNHPELARLIDDGDLE